MFRDLIKRILEWDPNHRITIPQILCHNWFSDYDEKSMSCQIIYS